MKWFGLILLLLLPGAARSAVEAIPALVTGDNVNLRTGPSRRAEIVGQVSRGDRVRVLLTDGEWSAIVPPPAAAAWISRDYLREGTVIGSRVNLRSGPSVAYPSLLLLEEGAEVNVLEEREGWSRIEFPESVRLWVNARFLSDGPAPFPTVPPSVRPRPEAVRPPAPPPVRPEVDRPPAPPPVRPEVAPPPPVRPELVPSPPPVRVPSPPPPVEVRRPVPPRPVDPSPRSYSGFVRPLDQPFSLADREYEYELAESRHAPSAIAYLTGETVDLSAYRSRRVRIWAVTIQERPGHPDLLEVKGAGFLW